MHEISHGRVLFGLFTLVLAVASSRPAAAQQDRTRIQPLDSPLTRELSRGFPELSSGYIDLNGNGKPDETEDVNEWVAESRVKDGQLQAQEILDFIVLNYRFIPLARLQAVQKALINTPGALNELIAINFSGQLDEVVKKREEMGDEPYLTPSAMKDALAQMEASIAAMTQAYKKEGAANETELVAQRDRLFAMIERGYPLPASIPPDERSTLTAAMINIVIKEKLSNPARAKTAMRTLGQLKAVEAASYLLELTESREYAVDAVKALGEIGYRPALPVMVRELKGASDPVLRKTALVAIGRIGGGEGLDTILDLVKPEQRGSLAPEILESVLNALAALAQKGATDFKIMNVLKDFSTSENAVYRKIAVGGLGAFGSPQTVEQVLSVLGSDKNAEVRRAAVAALAGQRHQGVIPAFGKVLREKELDDGLRAAVVAAIGENPNGAQAVTQVVDLITDRNPGVREAAGRAIMRLYPANAQIVLGALTRVVLSSQNETVLVEGTAILAALADPASLPTLLTLMQKPLPEVKKNVTWALYRIRAVSNNKVIEELAKIITSETEPVGVRINAVRAAGAIGVDAPQLNLWQTLLTTARMRGEKYAMLRLYAIRALGELGNAGSPVLSALVRIAAREPDPELKKEAVSALQRLSAANSEAEEALAGLFRQSEDQTLRLLVVEALADMGSRRASELAVELAGSQSLAAPAKRRVLYVLSRMPGDGPINALIDAAREPKLQEFAQTLIEDLPARFVKPVIARRLKTETNRDLIGVLEALDARFSDKF